MNVHWKIISGLGNDLEELHDFFMFVVLHLCSIVFPLGLFNLSLTQVQCTGSCFEDSNVSTLGTKSDTSLNEYLILL